MAKVILSLATATTKSISSLYGDNQLANSISLAASDKLALASRSVAALLIALLSTGHGDVNNKSSLNKQLTRRRSSIGRCCCLTKTNVSKVGQWSWQFW